MRKINYANVNLTCAFQQMTDLPTDHCIGGVLSRTENSFKFEEAVKQSRRPKRNPKLFDGKYITLVRKTNGKYQIHAKALRIEPGFNPSDVAFGYFQEVSSALKFIN